MNTKFKDFIKTPKGKLTVALAAMLLSWVFLLFNFSDSLGLTLPGEQKKTKLKQDIRKKKAELQTLEEKIAKIQLTRKRWQEMKKSAWNPVNDGDPELLLRQKIENAAKKHEIKLNNIGTVRINKINQEFSFAEMDISVNLPLDTLIKFISEIQQLKPAIAWRRLSITQPFRRPMPNNRRRTVFSNTDNALTVSANLRVLVFQPENGTEKQEKDNAETPALPKKNNIQQGGQK